MGIFDKPTDRIKKRLNSRYHSDYEQALAWTLQYTSGAIDPKVEFTLGAIMVTWVIQHFRAGSLDISAQDLQWFASYGQMCSQRGYDNLIKQFGVQLISDGVIPNL